MKTVYYDSYINLPFHSHLYLSLESHQTKTDQSIKDLVKDWNDSFDIPLTVDQYTTLLNINGDDGMVTYYYLMDNDLYDDYNISRSQWKDNQTLIKNYVQPKTRYTKISPNFFTKKIKIFLIK